MSKTKTPVEGQVTLACVRLSFPQLFEAKAVGDDPNGKPRFSCSFLIDPKDKANVTAIKAAIDKITKEKFNGKPLPDANQPFRDGNDKDWDGYEGMMYLSANRNEKTSSGGNNRPTVVDRDNSPLSADDGKPYGGCYVDAIVRFYSLGGKGDKPSKYGKKICCSLETVRFRKDGEPFGAARASLDDLPDIEDEGEDLPEDDDDNDGI